MYARIQYLSGLYLNRTGKRYPDIYPNPVAPILALLGDIGTPDSTRTLDFLHWCSEKYEKVIWVPGTEELQDARVWQDRLNQMEQAVENISNVAIGYGNPIVIRHKGATFTVVATPGWFNNISSLYTDEYAVSDFALKCLTEEEKQMTEESIQYSRLSLTLNPILLTYWPVFMDTKAPITANLYGKSKRNMTEFYNKTHWYGVNRADLWKFDDSAFYEFPIGVPFTPVPPKGDGGSSLDTLILKQITKPNELRMMC